MTPTRLALAAALLVCARAETNSNRPGVKVFPGIRVVRIFKAPPFADTKDSLPNNLKDKTFSSLKVTQRLFPEDRGYYPQKDGEVYHKFLEHETHQHNEQSKETESAKDNLFASDRQERKYHPKAELPSSCLYEGRWHADGSTVSTREDCLRCVCTRGALSCLRRACAPLPDPLPPRCHVRHRRGICCPELHCPDSVQLMEHGSLERSEDGSAIPEAKLSTARATPVVANNACVEGGVVFAAGSALESRVACEQCFCLRGERRCVRPACLPPPPHCAPRPAPGACCPQRYYCDTTPDHPDQHRNHYDCLVKGVLISEGSPVTSRGNCSACFCLRGEVRCQALGCAPALAGCHPVMAPGECCAHQYICGHDEPVQQSQATTVPAGLPTLLRYNERTFHSSKSTKLESTTKKVITSQYILKHTPFASATKNHLITTTKVKRKTDDPPLSSGKQMEQNTNTTSHNTTTTQDKSSADKLTAKHEPAQTPDNDTSPEVTTEQPEGTVKIMINGTINCTAELSSTSLPLSIVNDTKHGQPEVLPRVPIVNVEAQTYSPNDIITDRNVNAGFDENDTFTINVTSSLMTNTSQSNSRPALAGDKLLMPANVAETINAVKKKKGDYDYDYNEPTLPPSLPNLKIIPFVAADAVVDEKPTKDPITYPILEREDKFPVYYHTTADNKDTFPTRREDTYQPTQYPVFVMGKLGSPYSPEDDDVDEDEEDESAGKYGDRNEEGDREYTVSASMGSHVSEVTRIPSTSTTFTLDTPAMNRFSPPVETEGGFVPKGTGDLDGYYAMYPSTPSGPAVPHLTTSMQLGILKGECLSPDGTHVPGGQSIVLGCQLCTCSWVELSCEPRPCPPPKPNCRRLPPSNHSRDPCCGDLLCPTENQTNSSNVNIKLQNKQNETKGQVNNIPAEPPAINPQNKTYDTREAIVDGTQDTGNGSNSNTSSKLDKDPVQPTTTVSPTSTERSAPKRTTTPTSTTPTRTTTTSSTTPDIKHIANASEEDEEDEEEFSFGSVLKLLLSDSYETTTITSRKPTTRAPPTRAPTRTKTPAPPTRIPSTNAPSTNIPEYDTIFKPLPNHYILPQSLPLDTVDRIDHLVLGEATAIKRTTLRPITNKTTKPPPNTYATTERRAVIKDEAVTSATTGGPWPPSLGGTVPGLLKLAGCNIYGRMYRVGRIITELSTPCQECWCTEIGVQCKPLQC